MQGALVAVGNGAGFLGDNNDYRVAILSDTNGGSVARAEGLSDFLTTGEREDAGGMRDAFAVDDNATIVQRTIGEKNGFNDLRGGPTIHLHRGVNVMMNIHRALNDDQRANVVARKPPGNINHHADIFLLLLMAGIKDRQVAQPRKQSAQLRLKNDKDGQHQESEYRL